MLSNTEKIKIQELKKSGAKFSDILAVMSSNKYGTGQTAQEFSPASQIVKDVENDSNNSGYFSDVIADLGEAGGRIKDVIKDSSDKQVATVEADLAGEQSGASTALQHGANAIGTVGRVVGEGVFGVAKALAPQGMEDWVGEGVQKAMEGVMDNETVQKFVAMSTDEMDQLKEFNPEGYRNVQAILSGVGGAAELTGLKGGGIVANKLTSATSDLSKSFGSKAQGFIDSIDEGIIAASENIKNLKTKAGNTVSDGLDKFKTKKATEIEAELDTLRAQLDEANNIKAPEVNVQNNINVPEADKFDDTAIRNQIADLEKKFDAEMEIARTAAAKADAEPSGIGGVVAGIGSKVIDKAIEGAGKTAQTYRTLVDSSQTRIMKQLDTQALRDNAGLTVAQVENNIADMYVNAVSPGVKGKKKSLDGIVKNKQAAVSSVRDIVANKSDIEFRDIETNELVKGELPTNLWEFGSSVSTRKSQVYKKVIELVEGTDGKADTSRIVQEMDNIVNDPVYARLPEIQKKAQQAKEFFEAGDFKAEDIERLIQIENDGLQAFYRGGGTQADSVVNAIVANNLRDILDETVEQAQGEGVKALKAQYGALKAIETDVVHRALHNSQAREAGLVDMFGIRTIGDLSRGAVGDMGALRQGAGQILGEGFIKALNDRDAMIHRMFMVAEQTY